MKVFTKSLLESVNRMAQLMGFNNSVKPEFLAALPDDKFYAPAFEILHEHKDCKPCEPHVRCVFPHGGDYFSIDVEMGCYDLVPDFTTVLDTIRFSNQPEPAEAV